MSSSILLVCLLFNTYIGWSQEDFASLIKNINYRAQILDHRLNDTKDTLILSSPQRIHRLYTVVSASGKINEEVNDFNYRFPLKSLEKGKYLMVAQLPGLKIVFEVNVLQRQPFNQDVVTTLNSRELIKQDYNLKVDCLELLQKDSVVKMKPYNLTDLDRSNIQSRDECRRLMAIQREKLREKIKKKRLTSVTRKKVAMK